MAVYRVTARRAGRRGPNDILAVYLPAPLSRALPEGNHEFDAEFVDAGIMLTYIGPKKADARQSRAPIEDTPGWAK